MSTAGGGVQGGGLGGGAQSDADCVGAEGFQAVQQEAGVEGDGHRGAVRVGVDAVVGQGVVAAAGFDGDVPGLDGEPDRGAPVGDQGGALDGGGQGGGVRGDLGGVLGVEERAVVGQFTA